jgi:hypothetical protein
MSDQTAVAGLVEQWRVLAADKQAAAKEMSADSPFFIAAYVWLSRCADELDAALRADEGQASGTCATCQHYRQDRGRMSGPCGMQVRFNVESTVPHNFGCTLYEPLPAPPDAKGPGR